MSTEPALNRCVPCSLQLHDECYLPRADGDTWLCCCGGVDWSAPFAEKPRKSSNAGGQVKDPSDMDDARSTGRKRAAMMAPIFDGMVCEWAFLELAGGGVVPIVGCDGNLLRANTKDGDGGDLHHGPNKNTLDNRPGVNLHRICKSCHHTWHDANDKFYAKERPAGDKEYLPLVEYFPHDPFTRATPEQIEHVMSTRKSINKKQRDADPDLPNTLDLL